MKAQKRERLDLLYAELETGNGPERVVLQKLLCKGKLDFFPAVLIKTRQDAGSEERRMSRLEQVCA